MELNDPMNGEVTDNTTLNSQAHYTCNDGYCLNGNRYRTCQCGGNWTGTEPTCGKQLASFPGLAQLSVACRTEKRFSVLLWKAGRGLGNRLVSITNLCVCLF